MRPGRDRGKTRQPAAQVAILFLERHRVGRFTDINSGAIDDYGHTNLDFDSESPTCKRLVSILDKLNQLLGVGPKSPLRGHDAMHLVLFLDQIWDDYTKSWEPGLQKAQGTFSAALAKSAKATREGEPDEMWNRYGVWTRSNSDHGENIARRHSHSVRRMVEFLGTLTPLGPKRAFNGLERELIYWRDGAAYRRPGCGAHVDLAEAEIHHIKPHGEGGQTVIDNGALVHPHCHPKSRSDTEDFAKANSS